ncbi:capsule biosynthesis protein CapK [Schlegelella sp. S2-27]|uniref:Capsule biosynthesis protein CapK n=1 Tax=Caldimonas mangrovi TaxID=2944811 RepID=A0ABT0YK89_9BURK|nr:capsule biosynthesis protein CapK [Caldimonas mangrovi]
MTPGPTHCEQPPGADAAWRDAARLPGLSPASAALLQRLVQHPHAPVFRHRSGHRLTRADRWMVRWHHLRILHASGPDPRTPPGWAWRHARRCGATVPFFLARGSLPTSWQGIPTTSRADLAANVAGFVPRGARLSRLLCFTTSGTTGHPIQVPSHPRVAAAYFSHHCRALRLYGIVPRAGRGEIGIVLAGFQQRCFTYVSVNPLSDECGVVKLNLHPADWRSPDDRRRYLDDLRPELISGDPVSLAELCRLGLSHRPRAVLSTSMALSDGLRAEFEAQLQAPVLDLYSMNEAGPIAVRAPDGEAHVLLQSRLFVEIVDADGRALPEGEHGEIVLTGGFNPWLPLLRYRTGDHARLGRTRHGPALFDLQGRPPVRFRRPDGQWLNNIEVTHALKGCALVRWALHQRGDGSLLLKVDPPRADRDALRAALCRPFGPALPIDIVALAPGDKLVQYTSDLESS